MATFEITAPNGKTLEIEGDTPPSEQELDEIFAQTNTNTDSTQSSNTEPTRPRGNALTNFGKGLLEGYASIGEKMGRGVVNNKLRPLLGKQPLTDEQLDQAYSFMPRGEGISGSLGKFTGEIAPAFLIPETKFAELPSVANSAINGAIQLGTLGGLNSFADTGNPLPGAIKGVIGGSIVGSAMPVVGAGFKKATNWFLPRLGASTGGVSLQTIEQAVKPNSKALDINADQAQGLLTDTTNNVRNAYNTILQNAGQKVNDAINNLRGNQNRIPVEDLQNDITSTFDQYNGELINPARNMTGNLEQDLNNLVTSGANTTKRTLDPSVPMTQIDGNYANLVNYINANKSNPDVINNAQILLDQITKDATPELKQYYTDALSQDIDTMLNNKTVSPIDLQKIKQQIGHMVNWSDETARNYKNPILEQIYGKFTNKLSDLSPELQNANQEFAKLKSFQKNEGLNSILRPGNNIDIASSKLKNYNSTVTKGNTGRNVKDLENVLTANGYEPFLNTVDDINAALDLENSMKTGRNFGGITDLVKQTLLRPALRAVRSYNQSAIPTLLNKAKNGVNELSVPTLYGMIKQFENPELEPVMLDEYGQNIYGN